MTQKRYYLFLSFSALVLIASIWFCIVVPTSGQTPSVKARSLYGRQEIPVFGFYHSSPQPHLKDRDAGRRIVVVAWRDGSIIWSKNGPKGGPPYYQGTISQKKINLVAVLIEALGGLEGKITSMAYMDTDHSYLFFRFSQSDHGVKVIRNMDSGEISFPLREHKRDLHPEISKFQDKSFREWNGAKAAMLLSIPDNGVLIKEMRFYSPDHWWTPKENKELGNLKRGQFETGI